MSRPVVKPRAPGPGHLLNSSNNGALRYPNVPIKWRSLETDGAPTPPTRRSSDLHPELAHLPNFHPNPVHFADFAEAEHSHHRLVWNFVHHVYPRGPQANPPPTTWSTSVHTLHALDAQGTHSQALHHSIIKNGTQRVIIAHGPGIWQPGCTSTGSLDNAGSRLALVLPDAKGEIGHVPSAAVGDLPPTSWGYREVLRDVSLEVSDAPDGREYALYAPYASIFHVRALDSHGHPQVDRKSRAEIGIIVIYLRETDKQRRERREEQPNFGSAIMYTPEDKRGVTAALVGLAKSLLVALDADFIPSWSWRVMWSWTHRTLVVWGDGANVMCSCKVQSQETVYYGLPESEHPDGSLPLHVTWIDEHDGKLRRNAAVKIEFVDKIVDQHNMVQQTRFAVLQAFEDMELPVELCGVEHGIFSHQRSVVLGSH